MHASLQQLQRIRGVRSARDPDERTRFAETLPEPERRALLSTLQDYLEESSKSQEETDIPQLMVLVGGTEAGPMLLEHVESANPNLLSSVAEALGTIGSPDFVSALDEILEKPASGHDWVAETVAGARDAIRARAALEGGKDQWAAFQRRDAVILNAHTLKRLSMPGGDFAGMYIEVADLREADLSGACFRDAHLLRTDFCGACLRGADLTNADLLNTCFRDADLTDVVGLSRAQLETVFTNERTRLPDDLT